MKFKLHWGKAKVVQLFRSPLQETDFEGEGLWARAFPKPEPMNPQLVASYQSMAAQAPRFPYNQAGNLDWGYPFGIQYNPHLPGFECNPRLAGDPPWALGL